MHAANLNAAAAGLLDVPLTVIDFVGEAPQAAASRATEMMTRDRMPLL